MRRSFKKRRTYRRKYGRKGKSFFPKRSGGYFGVRRNTIQAERKFQDTALNAAANEILTAGKFFLLNGVGAGTGFNERVGRKIRIKSIALSIHFFIGAVTPSRFRIIVFVDRQANSAAVTAANLIDTATGGGQISTSYMNLDNRARFKFLYDKKFVMDTTTFTLKTFKMYKKIVLDTVYSGTTNAIGSIQTNAVWCVLLSDNAATQSATTIGTARIRFTDA